ncbi:MAG: alpha/beta hydrolase [Bdellovibrionales bacterium]|nr:alpha/beta hydrolase [Bdellovibrionales bacterium]
MAGLPQPQESQSVAPALKRELQPHEGVDFSQASLPSLPIQNFEDLREPPCPPTSDIDHSLPGGSVLSTVEKLVGEGAGLSWHVADPKALDRPGYFERLSKPFIIPGRTDLSSFLFFGGLTATGYPWRDFALKLFDRSGIHSEIYSLAGHDGTWKSLRDTTADQWVSDMHEKASRFERPPILFCYSTSVPVAFEVERRFPGTFAAIVAVAGPFKLRNERLETYLDRGIAASRLIRSLTLNALRLFRFASVPSEDSVDREEQRLGKRNPSFRKIPIPTAFSLRVIQKKGLRAASDIQCPVCYLQGEKDHVVSSDVIEMLRERIPSQRVEFHTYENGGHGLQIGQEKKQAFTDIARFLERTLRELHPNRAVPTFEQRISRNAVSLFVTGLVEAVIAKRRAQIGGDHDALA